MKEGSQFQLPKKRSGSLTEHVEQWSYNRLILFGFCLYFGIVLIFTGIECSIGVAGHFSAPNSSAEFLDLVYFNFVSILTIGYGDFSPLGIFRLLAIIEAILGLAIYSLAISIITIKLLLPGKNTIVFSKYAYFCTERNAFLIIYLNTATQYVTNLETTWYFKLAQDWQTGIPGRVPFITKSVQTFYLPFEAAYPQFCASLHKYDCLRVGLSGSIGTANYSTYVEYGLQDILIIKDRSELTNYPGFYKVDENLNTAEFASYFHYKPDKAIKMDTLVTP
jgi:hypothetical protein